MRTIAGARTKTLDALFDAFAEAWHFPPWFGRNRDAFDDCMRDFDNLINTSTGKPPAPGYLTDITDAHLLLVEQPDLFPWFANTMPFYRDYYRDEASPPAAFGLLLSAPADQLHEVRERWLTVGIQIAAVSV
ncbi:barstar family protein [Mycobacterium riyadhense]|uniref:barstar family protein n=1 Tax=Mycobacterium riyadhense TaxID=486698 RepID=UPI00146FB02F|nr:barstar family protein [Mycobacterium riyadhense]MCV7146271.1 barstar family protein [Mycobacterium riyadhense]